MCILEELLPRNSLSRDLEWIEWWPPKSYVHALVSETCKCDLMWKKFFVDTIKDLEMKRSPWVIWVGPKSNDKCPYKSHPGETDRRGNTAMGDRSVADTS